MSEDQAAPKPEGVILETLIKAAKQDREDFVKIGDEVEKYGASAKDFDFEYTTFDGGDLFFKAKVAKTAEAVDIFVPYFNPVNPTRRVTSRPDATPQTQARNQVLEQYLNYTPRETNLFDHCNRTIHQALTYGRGVMWTGFNKRNKLVQSVNDDVKNLYVDPDAHCKEEVNWVARKRIKPRWEARMIIPEAAEEIDKLDAYSERKSDSASKIRDHNTEMVCYYEVYARVGLHNYKQGLELIQADGVGGGVADDSPRKYYVAGNKLLRKTTWEFPWYLDNEWPCTFLDFIEQPGKVWGASPLGVGLGHQKALNWIYTLYLSKLRRTTRTAFALMEENGQKMDEDTIQKAIYGGEFEVLTVKWNGRENVKVSDIFQELKWTSGIDEFERAAGIIGREYEHSTGLYEVLYTGESEHQIRSAAEVTMKEQSSKSRINYRKDLVARFQSSLARKEAIGALFHMLPEDMGKLFGPQAQQNWGFIVDNDPQLLAMFPQCLTMEQALREADYTIEAGSMRRQDTEQEIDAYEQFSNQNLTVLLQNPNPQIQAVGMNITAQHFKAVGAPKELLDQIALASQILAATPMMMPQPTTQGA